VLVEIISEGGDSSGKASVRPVTAVTAVRSYTRQIQRILSGRYKVPLKIVLVPNFLSLLPSCKEFRQFRGMKQIN
jgi:hypothetical protein